MHRETAGGDNGSISVGQSVCASVVVAVVRTPPPALPSLDAPHRHSSAGQSPAPAPAQQNMFSLNQYSTRMPHAYARGIRGRRYGQRGWMARLPRRERGVAGGIELDDAAPLGGIVLAPLDHAVGDA